MNRRGFLQLGTGLILAPAVVKASSLMPIKAAPPVKMRIGKALYFTMKVDDIDVAQLTHNSELTALYTEEIVQEALPRTVDFTLQNYPETYPHKSLAEALREQVIQRMMHATGNYVPKLRNYDVAALHDVKTHEPWHDGKLKDTDQFPFTKVIIGKIG